jgi:hypothetical protein
MFATRVLVYGVWLMSAIACNANRSYAPIHPDAYIEVTLGEEVDSVPDIIKWPKYKDGRYQESRLIQSPSTMHLTLPSGQQLDYKVMNADLAQKNLRIYNVYLRLPTTGPDTEQAVSILETELNKLSPTDRDKCASRIKSLLAVENNPNALSGEQVGCYFEMAKGVKVRGGIETILGEQLKTEWIVFLAFSLHEDEQTCP